MREATNTRELLDAANNVMDAIRKQGLRDAMIELDDWRMAVAGYGVSRRHMGYAGYGIGKADWEVIIEHKSGVSVILRSYENDRRMARFAIGSDENAGRDRAAAHMANHYAGGAS